MVALSFMTRGLSQVQREYWQKILNRLFLVFSWNEISEVVWKAMAQNPSDILRIQVGIP